MTEEKKPGFFGRLFARKAETPAAEQPAPLEEPAETPVEAAPEPEPVPAETAPMIEEQPASAEPAETAPAPEPPAEEERLLDAPRTAAEALPPEPEAAPEPEPQPAPEAEPVFAEAEPRPESIPEPITTPAPATPRKSWFQRLKDGLTRSSGAIGGGIVGIFTKRKLDADTLEDLEDVLIQADLGVALATTITERLARERYGKDISEAEVKAVLAEEIAAVLRPVAVPFALRGEHRPQVVLVVGVNGSGKTTTIGKLAAKFKAEGKSVMIAAGDTFRAAAIDQLRIWAERTRTPIVAREVGADAAGLAYDALQRAMAEGADVLMIDTAGRLQNKAELMAELEKVVRVLRKLDPTAPHDVLLVLDATTGQNAISQTEIFGRTAGVTGLVMTKLDGTARGGILVALAEKFGLPVHFIGVGEAIDDLEPFTADDFARAIVGIEA